MQYYDKKDCNSLWKTMGGACWYIFQAVNNQQTDYCIRKHLSQILNKNRWCLSLWKNQKWQKSGRHSSQHNGYNGNDTLCSCHDSCTSGCKCFFNAIKQTIISAIDGIIKLWLPNMNRQIVGIISPISADDLKV